jgi:hypothetical protein
MLHRTSGRAMIFSRQRGETFLWEICTDGGRDRRAGSCPDEPQKRLDIRIPLKNEEGMGWTWANGS